jgi:hypothetical protein
MRRRRTQPRRNAPLPRLADRTGIEQHGFARRQRRRAAGRQPTGASGVRKRPVCVAEYQSAIAVVEPVQLGQRLAGRRRVLLRVVQRAVRHAHAPRRRGHPRKGREEGALVRAEDLSGPPQAMARQLDAAVVGQDPERDQVVVAGHARSPELGHRRHTFVRMGPVADQIARHEIAVDALAVDGAQDGAQGVEVPVDVGDNPVAHAARTRRLAARAAIAPPRPASSAPASTSRPAGPHRRSHA